MERLEKAVTAICVKEGWVLGLATENEAGYSRLDYGPYETEADARKVADHVNGRFGLSPQRALMVVCSSMFPAPADAHAERRKEWPS